MDCPSHQRHVSTILQSPLTTCCDFTALITDIIIDQSIALNFGPDKSRQL